MAKHRKRRNNVIPFRYPYREEIAGEITPRLYGSEREFESRTHTESNEAQREGGTLPGTLGLILALLAFLMMPFVLGISAFVLGYVAVRRGSAGLGRWTMGLSAVAVVLTFLLRPFY
ncbi:hypothetical protein [Aneurinibacillus uraniidurans]|uniref:hypothetical protein n=1 Tax=Aneurinibacillus uraniidurans TaxID=2966586 RepID=UPI002349336F|nr:hypothetical protein [Aneurinibacillus sp. B1]WCN37003.1 hypothetical protein PO771_14225 [Aneurinibacillus sp. B1]